MPIVAADWTVAANGDVRYVGDAHGGASPSYATVIEFHRFLQDLADDAVASGDDLLDITDDTPSDRSTDNIITLLSPYNIDQTASEHLYDGSIIQTGGDEIFDGIVNFGNAAHIEIIQDGALIGNAFWNQAGVGLNADAGAGISHRFMVQTRVNGADIDGRRLLGLTREFNNSYAEFPINGTSRGNNVLALSESSDLNNQTAAGTIATYGDIVNTEGYQLLDVNGDTVSEPYYSQWDLGTRSINDLYERTKWIQRRGTAQTIHGLNGNVFRGITTEWDYDAESGGPFTEDEILAWGTSFAYDGEANGPLVVGEYYSFSISGAVGQLIYLDDQGVTGNVVFAIEAGSGTVVDNDVMTRVDGSTDTATVNGVVSDAGATGGTGVLLALDDQGLTGTVWIQLLTGGAPVDNLPFFGRTSNATADVNLAPTTRTVSPAFVGQSTGSAIIGAFGIGIDTNDLTASDTLTDLTGTVRVPPNNVTFTVFGLVSGEDRVLVGPESAGSLQVNQFTLNTTLNGAAETAVVVSSAIPLDTPSTGTIRILNDAGIYVRQTYTSYTGSTFTIPSTDYSGGATATSGNNTFISYIDELAGSTQASFTGVYQSDRSLFVRVRDGGASPIKTFETTGTLGSAGGSATAIRTSDA